MNAILDGLKALGPSRLAALARVTVAMLGLITVLVARGGSERMALLYADLDLREAAQITDRLDAQHIPHQAVGGGSQIMVPADQVTRARLLLAKDSLPSGGSLGYEIFDRGDGFTSNEFQQNINHLRALEGELARTIRSINGVRAARVHLVLPKREPFSRDKQEAQASVLLTTAGAGRLDRETVQALVTLVAAAVPGLRPQNVAVVDSHGNLLARASAVDAPTQAAQNSEELRRGMEARLARAVEEMLEPSLGSGHVRAEATVEADFDKFSESQERYDPDGQVVRSTQTTSDASKSSEASPAVSVQNNLPNADAAAPPAGNQDKREEETTNYEISKTVRTIAREQAQIRRISLAVLVDGTEQRAPDGTVTWQPRPAEELDRISRLVKTAVGFDQKRGDQVEVVSMRFAAGDEAAPVEKPGLFGSALERTDLVHLAQTTLVGLVAITVLLLIVRPMVVRITTMPMAALGAAHSRAGRALGAPSGIAGLPGNADGPPLLSGPMADRLAANASSNAVAAAALLADESMVNIANIEGQLRRSSLRKLGELVEKHPEESLAIVRNWMQQEPS
jgi:flagellar M-ring protein FliF